MLVGDQIEDHDKTNIQQFLLKIIHKSTYFSLKTIILKYLEEVFGIKKKTSRNFDTYYKKYRYFISRELIELKKLGILTKFNNRTWRVEKKKIIENDKKLLENYKRIKGKNHNKKTIKDGIKIELISYRN